MSNRLFRYRRLGVFTMSVTQPCRHLQSSLESQECWEPTSHIRARGMQKNGILQSLSHAHPGQAGIARAWLTIPWNTARKQTGYVLPTYGSKCTQLGDGRFGKLSSPFFPQHMRSRLTAKATTSLRSSSSPALQNHSSHLSLDVIKSSGFSTRWSWCLIFKQVWGFFFIL